MAGYLLRRVIAALVTIWLAASAVFLIFFVVPGGAGRTEAGFSPVAVFVAGRNNSPSTLRRIERDLGLDRPVPVQYARYMSRLVRGDLGYSYAGEPNQRIPIAPVLKSSIRPTVELAIGASAVALSLGIAGGFWAARRTGRWTEVGLRGVSIVTISVPSFVVGLMTIGVLAANGIFVTGGYQPMSEGVAGWLESMLLPWVVLAFPFIGIYFRLVRSSMLEVANEDYIRAARAKGVSENGLLRHQLRAGYVPLVTAFGIDLAAFMGGSIIVEVIFGIPGLGSVMFGATRGQDFPAVAAVTIVAATAVVLLSLVVDIAYAYLDPRVSYARHR